MSDAPAFFVWNNGDTGPFRVTEIERMLADGSLSVESLVKAVGEPRYSPLRDAFVVDSKPAGVIASPTSGDVPDDGQNQRITGLEREMATISRRLTQLTLLFLFAAGIHFWLQIPNRPVPTHDNPAQEGVRIGEIQTNDPDRSPMRAFGSLFNGSQNDLSNVRVIIGFYDSQLQTKVDEQSASLEFLPRAKDWHFTVTTQSRDSRKARLEKIIYQ